MPTDSFKWLPRSIAGYYRAMDVPAPQGIPWTPLAKPLEQCRVALITTAGIYLKDEQPSFDLARERREPFWGDPTYRAIPTGVRQDQIDVAHLHINTEDILADINVALPIGRFQELVQAGEVGALADQQYSVMGYQPNTDEWRERTAPDVARRLRDEGVDAAFLTPV